MIPCASAQVSSDFCVACGSVFCLLSLCECAGQLYSSYISWMQACFNMQPQLHDSHCQSTVTVAMCFHLCCSLWCKQVACDNYKEDICSVTSRN